MVKMHALLFLTLFYSCNEKASTASGNYYSKIISEEYSPNGKYKFTLGELNDSINPSTQLIVNFANCASAVYNPYGKDLGIKAYWKTNDTIVVKCNNKQDKMKHTFAQCFEDKVIIKYIFE